MTILLALLIGIISGLRCMTAPAAASWGAYGGALRLAGTPLAWLGDAATPYVLTVLALAELVADQLPQTPSRKGAMGFSARLVSGALCGAAIGASRGQLAGGLVAGVVGAIIGTVGGYEARVRLAYAFRRDTYAALLEDCVAIAGAAIIAGVLA